MTGIIFDFDGTLVDTLPDIADAVNVGLKHYGFPTVPASEVRGWVGEGMPMLCLRAVGNESEGNESDVPIDEMAAFITAHYRQHRLDHTAVYPGIPQLLDTLTKRRIPLAILSNKPHEHMEAMTDALLGQWLFLAVEGYREEGRRKPNPQTALEIVKQMRLEPNQVRMVGDSAADMATAVNGKLTPIGVAWGYQSQQQLIDSGAKHIIQHPLELLQFV